MLLPDLTGRLCRNISARILNEKQPQEPKWKTKGGVFLKKKLRSTKQSQNRQLRVQEKDTILVYNARIEGLLTRSSEISPFISSSLKVDSQFSNCSGGPRHKGSGLGSYHAKPPKATQVAKTSFQLAPMYSKKEWFTVRLIAVCRRVCLQTVKTCLGKKKKRGSFSRGRLVVTCVSYTFGAAWCYKSATGDLPRTLLQSEYTQGTHTLWHNEYTLLQLLFICCTKNKVSWFFVHVIVAVWELLTGKSVFLGCLCSLMPTEIQLD